MCYKHPWKESPKQKDYQYIAFKTCRYTRDLRTIFSQLFPSIHILLSFYHEWKLDFVKAFSIPIIWLLIFISLIWCILLIYFQIKKETCIPEINHIWSRWIILFLYCWFSLPICFQNFCINADAIYMMSHSCDLLLILFD